MSIIEKVKATERLQRICYETYKESFPNFQEGMTEQEIAKILKQTIARKGVNNFWYDVPIIALIGVKRFRDGAWASYNIKAPSPDHLLKPGATVYIDLHPMDEVTGQWGDWNTMAVFKPGDEDKEQVKLLEEFRNLQREGFTKLRPGMTGADVARYYLDLFIQNRIQLFEDTRGDIGHTIESGSKPEANRLFLNSENWHTIGDKIYTIEPGGFRITSDNRLIVARFEECVYIPNVGQTRMLGYQEPLPVVIP